MRLTDFVKNKKELEYANWIFDFNMAVHKMKPEVIARESRAEQRNAAVVGLLSSIK